jgi:hypothetical protein
MFTLLRVNHLRPESEQHTLTISVLAAANGRAPSAAD